MTEASKIDVVLRFVRERGMVRPRDLVAQDIPPDYLDRLFRRGLVDRVGRGVYAWPEAEVTEHHSLIEAALKAPSGVVCLLSALRFHGLTTQLPHEVWLCAAAEGLGPKDKYPKLRLLRFSGAALSEMVEEHTVEGVTIRVYRPPKTVADCFKYRNKVGIDLAIEALRDCWRGRRTTMDELWAAANVCRMANVMLPYLESLV